LYFFFFATKYVGTTIRKLPHFALPLAAAIASIFTSLVVKEASASFEGITLVDGPLYYVVFALVIGYCLAALGFIFKEVRGKHKLSLARKQANVLFIVAVLQALIIVSIVAAFFAAEPISQ